MRHHDLTATAAVAITVTFRQFANLAALRATSRGLAPAPDRLIAGDSLDDLAEFAFDLIDGVPVPRINRPGL